MPATALDKLAIFERCGYRPHDLQREVHTCEAPRRVLACGVRWGKSLSSAMEAVAAALEPGEVRRGWVVAPNYDLCDKVFREVAIIVSTHLPMLVQRVSAHDRLLMLTNMGGGTTELRGKTADNPVSLLGESLDFCVIDEAARLKPDIWERYLAARLIDRKGWALMISTPKGKGWFYDAWRRGQHGRDPLWKSWNAPTWSNPHLDKSEIDAVRERIPEAIFRQEYGAEFLEGAGQVFRNVRDRALCDFEPPKPGEEYVAGLDLARTTDYTVLVVLDSRRHVVHVERFTRLDWRTQITRIAATAARYNDAWVVVDATGAGEPVLEAMLEAGIRCEGYTFTTASKSEAVNNLALMLEREQITLPREQVWPEGIDELESYEFSVTDRGGVSMNAPPGMHDDCVTGTILAAWAARDAGGFVVQEI